MASAEMSMPVTSYRRVVRAMACRPHPDGKSRRRDGGTTPSSRTRKSTSATVAEVDFLVRELGVVPPSRLLDLPSGCGRHAIALTTRRYEVTGIDISADAISAAESEAKAQGVSVNFIQGDMRRVPAGGP